MSRQDPESRHSSAEEASLWERYVSSHDTEARVKLIERYLMTARKLAAALYANRYDDSVEFGDYLQYARVGLLEAIDRYDPTREASFATFASYRIRGAILTGIERSTEIATQKAQRRRIRRERLRSVREASGDAGDDAFARMIDVTLNLAIGYLLEESGIWKAGEGDRSADPYQSLELKRLGERMATLVEALPERERCIVHYHYFEHKEFIDISVILGVSKGRISQLHARALKLLRDGYKTLNQFDQRF